MTEKEDNSPDNKLNQTIADTHKVAKGFLRNRNENQSPAPTKKELQEDAERAEKMVENLHNTIKENTPKGSVKEAMSTDRKNADKAQNDIKNGKDPLAAYAGYSAYAVPQDSVDNPHRNYYKNPLIYDEYTVTENKNEKSININVAEFRPGGKAHATNNENDVVGSSVCEESYSYNEKTSGGKTIITTKETKTGTHTPSSSHIANGETYVDTFTNTKEHGYVYDKNNRLIEQTSHSESSNLISHSRTKSKNDLSQPPYDYSEHTDVSSLRDGPTRFTYSKKSKDATKMLDGYISNGEEAYTLDNKGKALEVRRYKNDKGEWVYEGKTGTTQNNNLTKAKDLSPKKAEKAFQRLQKTTNTKIEGLTNGETNSLADYAKRLGTPKPKLSANAYFLNTATTESAEKATKENNKIKREYAQTPAVIAAIKRNQGR